ncbi:hypothetical protein CAEBREN_09760 [Caenorhabditis brenneri]|uniref:Uncharacterized protein n=1 Tax=Caenorhabditis brenneri TaxID=135651 RepID=G0NYW2_CAEBE|nr:hypothetical protein CAEBREN_09760 [Caenorhabditis brenneri]
MSHISEEKRKKEKKKLVENGKKKGHADSSFFASLAPINESIDDQSLRGLLLHLPQSSFQLVALLLTGGEAGLSGARRHGSTRACPASFARPPSRRRLFSSCFRQSPDRVSGIGCFVCSSFDGENKGCEDPFNSTMDLSSRDRDASAVANYNYPCWAYKKGRHGLFPADHCIKIVGYRADNDSKTLVIRTCALDSGTLTADTEIDVFNRVIQTDVTLHLFILSFFHYVFVSF